MFNCLLSALIIASANPADLTGRTLYPSGSKSIDGHVFNAPKQSLMPVLRVSNPIKYKSEIINVGMYKILLDDKKEHILFIQNGKIISKIKVIKIIQHNKSEYMPSCVITPLLQNSIFIVYKFENIEAHSIAMYIN